MNDVLDGSKWMDDVLDDVLDERHHDDVLDGSWDGSKSEARLARRGATDRQQVASAWSVWCHDPRPWSTGAFAFRLMI